MNITTWKTWKKRLSRGGVIAIATLGITFFFLIVGAVGMHYQTETQMLRTWFYETRFGWLGWRLVLYVLLGWGFWKIRKAPGFREEHKLPLLRMGLVSILFILVCEYAAFNQTGQGS